MHFDAIVFTSELDEVQLAGDQVKMPIQYFYCLTSKVYSLYTSLCLF